MKYRLLAAASASLLATACVEHRPIRSGLANENVYLNKTALTNPDDQFTQAGDDQWLYRVTVVGASSPNVVGDYAFPGFESDPMLVQFRFRSDALQVVDGRRLQEDRPLDPNDNLADTDDNVLFEFAGQHLDVKLRESLDGERTNYLEENTEADWEVRQTFKMDFASTSMEPITSVAWFYGEFLHECATPVATHLVPDTYRWQTACTESQIEAEYKGRRAKYEAALAGYKSAQTALSAAVDADIQALEADVVVAREALAATASEEGTCSSTGEETFGFELESTYLLTVQGGCYNMTTLANGTGTSTIRYHYSFTRPKTGAYVGEGDDQVFKLRYEPEEIGEKELRNKKYGVFQLLNLFTDHEAGELGARAFAKRWDPSRADMTFYFQPGFPERYKAFFSHIAEATNAVFEKAGATIRLKFVEFDDGGIIRHVGDMRYSFAQWHHDIDTTRGLLGYGPSAADPRTGEVLNANLNLYNIGMDYYRFTLENFLETTGARLKPEEDKAWEEIDCAEGSTVAPGDESRCTFEKTQADQACESAADADAKTACLAVATAGLETCKQRPRLTSALFNEMRRVMNVPDEDVTAQKEDFVPTPTHPDFAKNFHRLLPELRYAEPAWNSFVWMTGGKSRIMQELIENKAAVADFEKKLGAIQANLNPFGPHALGSREGIEAQVNFMDEFRDWRGLRDRIVQDEEQLLALTNIEVFDANDAITAAALSSRRCITRPGNGNTWESDREFSSRVVNDIIYKVAIHEFGHNVGLRHNFYGSVDAKHMRAGETSASVMDYVSPIEEASSPKGWGRYDELAIQHIYGNEAARTEAMAEDVLYCTDEHRGRSPLCRAFDFGVTPAQIAINAIERYDWLYELRNKRAWRKFWDTSGYAYSVYDAVFSIQRMWHLAIFDWGGGGVQSVLKRLDQVDAQTDETASVKTDQEYDEISVDFYNDISAAVGINIAFYDAIINQPAAFRNYQTEFDPFYGDVIRVGIILDKLFATFAFMDLQDISAYNPNVATYAAMYDAPFGAQNDALAQRVLDNMLGANYDTFPWFKYYALNIFAAVTNSNLVGNIQLRDRIAIKRFNRAEDLEAEFHEGAIADATRSDNAPQIFVHDGKEYVYSYLADRSWHLVADRSRSPVSYQFMREYNESLNSNASGDEDNFGLKILLAYYEYFNNFVGF